MTNKIEVDCSNGSELHLNLEREITELLLNNKIVGIWLPSYSFSVIFKYENSNLYMDCISRDEERSRWGTVDSYPVDWFEQGYIVLKDQDDIISLYPMLLPFKNFINNKGRGRFDIINSNYEFAVSKNKIYFVKKLEYKLIPLSEIFDKLPEDLKKEIMFNLDLF